MEEKPQLTVWKFIREKGYLSQCSQFGDKNERRMMVMIRGRGTCPSTNTATAADSSTCMIYPPPSWFI